MKVTLFHLILFLSFMASGCGQSGKLYIPNAVNKTSHTTHIING